ncbi:protein SHQ1-like protein [Dinothrombium tinctorium]|uniref:Protein SHQ1 homolog n=1 Tax=Dinothrombium tinctorium TaxID=1965070 RepID=A0A3S3PHD3_9ACAR|nr:protein SHQ1-like protein [Dinothrombium tinctorium]RWS09582.1 protein SHQ1-like protein [Dinothrombium tinctorium]RWS09670.1 protein SHQ1-like protein [Dinothrombium tinctorium]RWS11167.1 protein SHQ1-like protein [Dinothrombium tinctorium]
MITPAFSVAQDFGFLYVHIKAPFAKIGDTEIDFFEKQFRFFSKPYFLRLSLPANVVQNGNETVTWDADSNTFCVKLPKLNEGEHFEDLDMITKLLTVSDDMKMKTFLAPKVEVSDSCEKNDCECDEEEYDWHFEQKQWTESDQLSLNGEKYGFANNYTGVFARFGEELHSLVDIRDPEKKTILERRAERIATETAQFSDDHYLADLYEQQELILNLISFRPFWEKEKCNDEFTEDEVFRLKNLPKKQFMIDRNTKYHLLLGLVDILFAFAFETRVTEEEFNVESGWTITKLSSTLSWFEIHDSLKDAVIASLRRSLCYPLYRNWDLSIKVLNDVATIIDRGKRVVLKCFLHIHKILNESGDSRYIFNDLYITDYCVWLQAVKAATFESLAAALKRVEVTKECLNLDLTLLEKASLLALEEKNNADKDEAVCRLSNIHISQKNDRNKVDEEDSSSFTSTDSNESSNSSSNSSAELDSDDYDSDTENSSDLSGESSSENTDMDLNTDACKRYERSR